jgi:hypothetical protein
MMAKMIPEELSEKERAAAWIRLIEFRNKAEQDMETKPPLRQVVHVLDLAIRTAVFLATLPASQLKKDGE